MPRGALPLACAPFAIACVGCSLVLDFDKPTDAAPADAPVTTEQCAAGEPNDTPGVATAWLGTDISAAICGSPGMADIDLFALTLTDGQPIRATITFMNRGGAGDLDLRLLTGDGGMVLDDSRTSGDTETVLCPGGTPCPAITAGQYLIEVKGFTAAVQSAYVLHIENSTSVDAGVDAP